MLDSKTKRRIDTARDILVGKVPDPKSQVEQITIALIYKFMDDIDAEAEEIGGMRQFFVDGFSRYGWSKLMRSGLGGHETLNLYAEAISKMPENSSIPTLFRDIFKNAYLPYRDPETLKSFLKVIDEFTYDHSERLGDAFEYLLSVLGSQGKAGQFRTPRHIIDFIVSIIDPQKNETILDPACGTAGFLISSYKHILHANTDGDGQVMLTPDEKSCLAENLKGYDISPDMVRLSLANLYLHGFLDPHVYEYDTLTSEERWNENADVILANPPFMSPKGGIKPHQRFSIKAKRSEVLFVDYIAEHLNPLGRAGIIVPEGIIFRSSNAYKCLRKMLVEEYLVAIVSLPAGVFNPYSDVKTSILILDKVLAKKADYIAFFKVENDGFDLGDQRRPIEKNDLPQAYTEIAEYLHCLRTNESVSKYTTDNLQPTLGLIVEKEKIAADDEYNLSRERYQENDIRPSIFPYVRLGDIAEIASGSSAPQGDHFFTEGKFPFIRMSDVGQVHLSDNFLGSADKLNLKAVEELRLRMFPKGTILFPKSGASTFLNHRVVLGEDAYVSSHLACIICNEKKGLSKYVYHLLCQIDARSITPDQAYPSLRLTEIGDIQISLPPLEVQQEIVEKIESYQKVIDGARVVLDSYRPHIPIDSEWPIKKFGDVISTVIPPKKIQTNVFPQEGRFPIIDQSQNAIAGYTDDEEAIVDGTAGLVIFGDHTCAVKFIDEPFAQGADGIKIIRVDAVFLPKFVYFYLLSNTIEKDGYKRHFGKLKECIIPVPPIEVQKTIVEEIEVEQHLIESNNELITRFQKKIEAAITRVWGREHAKDNLK